MYMIGIILYVATTATPSSSYQYPSVKHLSSRLMIQISKFTSFQMQQSLGCSKNLPKIHGNLSDHVLGSQTNEL